MLYKNNLKESLNALKDYSVSIVDSVAPEIKTSFSKSDDIGLLYSVNKLSKFKNITESFILNKDLTVVIHNDSSKWNKKYSEPIYQNAVSAKSGIVTPLPNSAGFLYSIQIDDANTLCVISSAQNILAGLNGWKIKLYAFSFVLSLIFSFCIYYMSKILFLLPFNKTKKALSMKDKMPKTIYSQLIDMVMVDVNNLSSDLNVASDNSNLTKQLLAYVAENYISVKSDVFAVLDSNAKIVYCLDKNSFLFKDKNLNTHIFNAINNAVIIKNISVTHCLGIGSAIQHQIHFLKIVHPFIGRNGGGQIQKGCPVPLIKLHLGEDPTPAYQSVIVIVDFIPNIHVLVLVLVFIGIITHEFTAQQVIYFTVVLSFVCAQVDPP